MKTFKGEKLAFQRNKFELRELNQMTLRLEGKVYSYDMSRYYSENIFVLIADWSASKLRPSYWLNRMTTELGLEIRSWVIQ